VPVSIGWFAERVSCLLASVSSISLRPTSRAREVLKVDHTARLAALHRAGMLLRAFDSVAQIPLFSSLGPTLAFIWSDLAHRNGERLYLFSC
jgi:hypothetical protein